MSFISCAALFRWPAINPSSRHRSAFFQPGILCDAASCAAAAMPSLRAPDEASCSRFGWNRRFRSGLQYISSRRIASLGCARFASSRKLSSLTAPARTVAQPCTSWLVLKLHCCAAIVALGLTACAALVNAATVTWMRLKWPLRHDLDNRVWAPQGNPEFPCCPFSGVLCLCQQHPIRACTSGACHLRLR